MKNDDDQSEKAGLKKIPTSKFSRGTKLGMLGVGLGAQALGGKISEWLATEDDKKNVKIMSQIKQAQKLVETLSQIKGAAMKLGQILSLYGDDLLPKEVVTVLSALQNQSQALEWDEMEKVLIKDLGQDYSKKLINISKKPIASASIGQVHQAEVLVQGESVPVAVKIQYPGVEDSIDSDVDTLASLVSFALKFGENFEPIIEEIKSVLKQETDYIYEAKRMVEMKEFFSNDDSLVVPEYYEAVSSKSILTSKLLKGISVQAFSESTANQEARDFLGSKYLEVFYKELFELGKVQTDPNFANYKIQWSFGVKKPKLVLLDFGAVKIFPDEFIKKYRLFMKACLEDKYDDIRDLAVELNFLREEDSKELIDKHYELIRLFMEPFEVRGAYNWGETDVAQRIRTSLPNFALSFKLRPPPKDLVFLNRKIVGVYFFASQIKSKYDPRPILEKFVLEK